MTKFDMGAEAEVCLSLLVLGAVTSVTRPHVKCDESYIAYELFKLRGEMKQVTADLRNRQYLMQRICKDLRGIHRWFCCTQVVGCSAHINTSSMGRGPNCDRNNGSSLAEDLHVLCLLRTEALRSPWS